MSTRVLAAGLTAVLALALAGCGSATGRTDPRPSLCSSANSYLWYGGELGGRSGSVPTGTAAQLELEWLLTALDQLSLSVPTGMRDDVELSRELWSDVDALLKKYDYGTSPVPPDAYDQMMAKYQPHQHKARRLTEYLTQRCAKTSTPFPSAPSRTASNAT